MTAPAVPSASSPIQAQIPAMMATLACYEGMFGPYSAQTLGLTTALAVALCESGRAAEGRPLLQRALLDLTRHHGPNHPVRLRALQAWSALMRQDGDSRAAFVIQRELAECAAPSS
jgi:hypothetical protein